MRIQKTSDPVKCPDCSLDLIEVIEPLFACSNKHIFYFHDCGSIREVCVPEGIILKLALEVINLREKLNPPELPIVASICMCAQCQDMRKNAAAIAGRSFPKNFYPRGD